MDKLPLDGSHVEFTEQKKRWCVEWARPVLASAATLTKRYYLEKTIKEKGPTDRQLQVARTHRATALLGVSFYLIGQASATRSVTQKLLTHMAMPRSKPLVMVFAGMFLQWVVVGRFLTFERAVGAREDGTCAPDGQFVNAGYGACRLYRDEVRDGPLWAQEALPWVSSGITGQQLPRQK